MKKKIVYTDEPVEGIVIKDFLPSPKDLVLKKKDSIKISYDPDADIFWVNLESGTEDYYKEFVPGLVVEFNEKDSVIGIEVQNYSRFVQSELNAYDTDYKKTIISYLNSDLYTVNFSF